MLGDATKRQVFLPIFQLTAVSKCGQNWAAIRRRLSLGKLIWFINSAVSAAEFVKAGRGDLQNETQNSYLSDDFDCDSFRDD
jgi:hypothetical protein